MTKILFFMPFLVGFFLENLACASNLNGEETKEIYNNYLEVDIYLTRVPLSKYDLGALCNIKTDEDITEFNNYFNSLQTHDKINIKNASDFMITAIKLDNQIGRFSVLKSKQISLLTLCSSFVIGTYLSNSPLCGLLVSIGTAHLSSNWFKEQHATKISAYNHHLHKDQESRLTCIENQTPPQLVLRVWEAFQGILSLAEDKDFLREVDKHGLSYKLLESYKKDH